MANGPRYRVPLKRRKTGKTDYYQRRGMLKSGETRAVIRKTSKNMLVQFVDAKPDGDVTLVTSNSRHLQGFGWKITGGNIPAAYLTGYLTGKKAVKAGSESAIADLGLQVTSRGGRIFATLKGLIDAGIEIPANEAIFPEEDVLKGAHIASLSKHLEENNKDALKRFAKYKSAKQKIDGIAKSVDKVKKAIDAEF